MKTFFSPGDWVVPKNTDEEKTIIHQASILGKNLPVGMYFCIETVFDSRTRREFLNFKNCDVGFYSDRFKLAPELETPLEDWL